jgi:hypothetical protein
VEIARFSTLVCTALERVGVDYFVTGSVASCSYGEGCHTHDVDIAAEFFPRHADELAGLLPRPEFHADAQTIREVALHGGMCNIIHVPTGLKADFIEVRWGAWEESRWARRRRVHVEDGPEVWMNSPEDLVLAKALFYDEGRSD